VKNFKHTIAIAGLALAITTAVALPATASARPAGTTVAAASTHPASSARAKGSWPWWGYRTNSWQTWAVATQSPTYIKFNVIPGFAQYVYVQAWVWKLTAQNARRIGQCLGITWTGSGLIVGCSPS
jgi:hypothetical protein